MGRPMMISPSMRVISSPQMQSSYRTTGLGAPHGGWSCQRFISEFFLPEQRDSHHDDPLQKHQDGDPFPNAGPGCWLAGGDSTGGWKGQDAKQEHDSDRANRVPAEAPAESSGSKSHVQEQEQHRN